MYLSFIYTSNNNPLLIVGTPERSRNAHPEHGNCIGGWITTSNITAPVDTSKRSLVVICHGLNMQLTENVVSTHTVNILRKFLPSLSPLSPCRTTLTLRVLIIFHPRAPGSIHPFPAGVPETRSFPLLKFSFREIIVNFQ